MAWGRPNAGKPAQFHSHEVIYPRIATLDGSVDGVWKEIRLFGQQVNRLFTLINKSQRGVSGTAPVASCSYARAGSKG
jgi:hypothetical protein